MCSVLLPFSCPRLLDLLNLAPRLSQVRMRLSPHISCALVTLQGTWHWYHKIGEKPWHVSGEDLHTNHAAKVQVAIFSHQLLLDPAPTRAYDHQLLSKSLQKGQVCYRHSEYATFFCLVSLLDRSLLSSFLALLATSLSLSTGFPIAAEGTCNTKQLQMVAEFTKYWLQCH